MAVIVTFQPPPHLRIELAGAASARAGRRSVGALVAGAHAEIRASALLITSELVTNAVQAAEVCTLSAWYLREREAFRIEIADASLQLPVLRRPGDGRVGGFGLRIVEQLSTSWGVIPHEGGKTVWAEIQAGNDHVSELDLR